MAQFTIRVPDELRDDIKAAAERDDRSMNGEINWLLRVGLEQRLADQGTQALKVPAKDTGGKR
jgi:hypothetical protein